MFSLVFVLSLLPSLSFANASVPAAIIAVETCGFQGDDNTYGLGIRLGLYLQWITTILADNFVPDEAISMRGVNNCFQLSTFIALLYITLTRPPSQLYAVEAWLLLLFCMGGVASGRAAGNAADMNDGGEPLPPPPTFSGYGASTIGGLIQFALLSALVFYAIWFIYIGMDHMAHPPCSRAAFFFTKVDLYHWFRTFLKVIVTFSGVLTGLGVVLYMSALFKMVNEKGISEAASEIFSFNEEVAPATVQVGQRRVTELRHISFVGLDLIFFILSTEFLIKWNHITGVASLGSTGQLIPLIVGGTGFVKVLYKVVVKSVRGDYQLAHDFDLSLPCLSSSTRRRVTHTANTTEAANHTGMALGPFVRSAETTLTMSTGNY